MPPRSLETVAPGLLCELGAVPLHHYYLISREQPAVDKGDTPVFNRWTLEAKTFATLDGVVNDLLTRIYSEPCPMPPAEPKFPWALVIALFLATLIGAAALGGGVWLTRDFLFTEQTERFNAVNQQQTITPQWKSASTRS